LLLVIETEKNFGDRAPRINKSLFGMRDKMKFGKETGKPEIYKIKLNPELQ